MTAIFQVDGSNLNIVFTYTAPTATMQDKLGKAAEYLWNHVYGERDEFGELKIPFDTLTNQQKLNLIDNHLRRVVLDLAITYVAEVADLDKFVAIDAEMEIEIT